MLAEKDEEEYDLNHQSTRHGSLESIICLLSRMKEDDYIFRVRTMDEDRHVLGVSRSIVTGV
jgi:hypothetical protein